MYSKIIAVDFDGTLCENKWPDIGEPMYGTISYLLKEQKQGAKLILWTCRIDDMLQKAVAWCADKGLIFDAVNENLPEIIESFGSDTRKIFANEYIDDRNRDILSCLRNQTWNSGQKKDCHGCFGAADDGCKRCMEEEQHESK